MWEDFQNLLDSDKDDGAHPQPPLANERLSLRRFQIYNGYPRGPGNLTEEVRGARQEGRSRGRGETHW